MTAEPAPAANEDFLHQAMPVINLLEHRRVAFEKRASCFVCGYLKNAKLVDPNVMRVRGSQSNKGCSVCKVHLCDESGGIMDKDRKPRNCFRIFHKHPAFKDHVKRARVARCSVGLVRGSGLTVHVLAWS